MFISGLSRQQWNKIEEEYDDLLVAWIIATVAADGGGGGGDGNGARTMPPALPPCSLSWTSLSHEQASTYDSPIAGWAADNILQCRLIDKVSSHLRASAIG